MRCLNFDEEDQICIACHLARVENQQSCCKPSERAENRGLDLALKCIKEDDREHCDAVQKVLEALCGVCGKCNKGAMKSD